MEDTSMAKPARIPCRRVVEVPGLARRDLAHRPSDLGQCAFAAGETCVLVAANECQPTLALYATKDICWSVEETAHAYAGKPYTHRVKGARHSYGNYASTSLPGRGNDGGTVLLPGATAVEYHAFLDIGLVHDPSVLCVAHSEDGLVYVDQLLTFQGSRATPVRISTLEAALLDLTARFNLARIRVESWQGAGVAQSLQRLGLPVELFAPTPRSNAEEWPQLAQRLAKGTLVVFPHARLREELLGLTVEVGATGAKVVDRGA